MALRQPAAATRRAGRRTLLRYRISLHVSPTSVDADAYGICSNSGAWLRMGIKDSHIRDDINGARVCEVAEVLERSVAILRRK